MLRRRLDDMPPWAASLIVVGLFSLLALVSPPHQPSDNSGYATPQYESENQTWEFDATDAAAFFTGVLALFAFIQVRDSRKSSQRQLRAYVSAIPLNAALRPDNMTMSVGIPLKNCGQTPAFEFRSRTSITVMPVPVPMEDGRDHLDFFPDPKDVGKPVPTFVIFPDSSHISNPVHTFTFEESVRIATGWGIYVSGRCEYTDAFGHPQWTEFCSVLRSEDIFDWTQRAQAGAERKAVEAAFKFTSHNNRASMD
jgi:hypothetical protein